MKQSMPCFPVRLSIATAGHHRPPYDYQMEYIGVLDTSKHKDAFGFAIGHLLGGRVIIDVVKYFFPDKGVLNWNHVTNEIIQICRRYRVDHLLHDGYEGEAVKLYFNNFLLDRNTVYRPV